MKRFLKWYIPVFVLAALLIFLAYRTDATKPDDSAVDAVLQEDGVGIAMEEEMLAVPPPVIKQEKDTRITVGPAYGEKLVEEGSRNILIIGEDKMNDLYDTICIASIDQKNKKLRLIMIPRDTYIEYGSDIAAYLDETGKSKSAGIYKINCTHLIGSMVKYKGKFNSGPSSFLAQVIKEKFGVEVDDYVKINTSGFASLVDLYGGVDYNVPYLMNFDDPTQDLHIHLKKGQQHLSGSQAEGFVRFRQGYKEDGTFFEIGDIARKKNQLSFIQAFIKQHGTVAKIDKIPKLISLLGKNVQHSIGVGDVLQVYIGLGKDIIADKYAIETVNLEGKQAKIKGSAYVLLD